jgi:outer membrane immunogenic protein
MRTTQKLFAGLASLSVFDVAAATAADLPLKASGDPRNNIAPRWTGVHIGAGLGVQWTKVNAAGNSYIADFKSGQHNFQTLSGGSSTDVLGTIEAGYDYQVNNTIVVGIGGHFNFVGERTKSAVNAVCPDAFGTSCVQTLSTEYGNSVGLTGRLGFIAGQDFLVYGLGGIGFGEVSTTYRVDASGFFFDGHFTVAKSEWRAGYIVGAGVEKYIRDRTTIKVEYRYEDYGDLSRSIAGTSFGAAFTSSLTTQSVRAVVSRRFN